MGAYWSAQAITVVSGRGISGVHSLAIKLIFFLVLSVIITGPCIGKTITATHGHVPLMGNTIGDKKWNPFVRDLSALLIRTGVKKTGQWVGGTVGAPLFSALGKKLPESLAKTLLSDGPAKLATILKKEVERGVSQATFKGVGVDIAEGLMVGIVIEGLVVYVRNNYHPQSTDFGAESLHLNTGQLKKEAVVFAIREAAVLYAYTAKSLAGHPILAKYSAIVAQAEVTGKTIYETIRAGVELKKLNEAAGHLQNQNAIGERFLKLRNDFKAEKDIGGKRKILAKIDELLSSEGSFLFAGSSDQEGRKHYIENLAKNAGLPATATSKVALVTALIIDRSGSMIGVKISPKGKQILSKNKSDLEKFSKAKEAAKAYILSRNGNDLVSISTFSNAGSTELGIATVSSIKDQLDAILARIKAENETNIGAGLEQGFAQLSSAKTTGNKMAVLLSDGANNRGDWHSVVEKFKKNGWAICTIGFGTDADERTLRNIAEQTGCSYNYEYADTVDIVNKFQALSAYAEGKSTVLSVHDALPPQGKTTYPFHVSKFAKMIDVFTSWQGSKLEVKLTDPNGKIISKGSVAQGSGRYEEGDTFQMLELEAPIAGKWLITTSWEVPPTEAERVNLLIAEKTEAFGRIHGFRSQYSIGDGIAIKVDAHEILGSKKVPLAEVSVSVQVQKPGPKMIRMVQAQSTTWTMYKEVVLDVTRDVSVLDDGNSDDYQAGDGIFGGSYTETDTNGAYLVTAVIKGKKRNGKSVEKTLTSSFQVGPIMQNQVTNSQTLQYMEDARLHLDSTSPYSDELLQSPLKRIEQMQDDPLKRIEEMQN